MCVCVRDCVRVALEQARVDVGSKMAGIAKLEQMVSANEEDGDPMDGMDAQIAALAAGMGINTNDPEDKVSKADVDKVIADVMASVGKAEKRASKKKGGADVDDEDDAKPKFAEGNEFLQKGIKSIKTAVVHDQKGKPGLAAQEYNSALENFAEVSFLEWDALCVESDN